ncbi:MAG: V-type ATP synthase subunit D [Rubrivivax sp.]|nr:V-type ATP synthase subunit D [Rubrivivax sp.]
MADTSPTRSAVIEMKDERRAMHEGYVFLDEKCLLLAGEILRQLAVHARLQAGFEALHTQALATLAGAVARHGLEGLQLHPPPDARSAGVQATPRSLMGVKLQAVRWQAGTEAAPPAVQPSPEAAACRSAFATALAAAAELAGVAGNLERLSFEYRRAVRRARALQDVMLPELERSIADIEGRLDELEQEDAVWMRQGAAR